MNVNITVSNRQWVKLNSGRALRHNVTVSFSTDHAFTIKGCLLQRRASGELDWSGPMTGARGRLYPNVEITLKLKAQIIEAFVSDGLDEKVGYEYENKELIPGSTAVLWQ